MDFDRINQDALANAEGVLRSWFPAGKKAGREYQVGGLDGSVGKSLSINLTTGVWCDFATGEKGRGLIALLAAKDRIRYRDAAERISGGNFRNHAVAPPLSKPAASRATKSTPLRPVLPLDSHRGSIGELRRLALLRNLPCFAGLELATRRGLLTFGSAMDGTARVAIWCLSDAERRVAQWRRLDGTPWQHLAGKPKAMTRVTQPGEGGWPCGLADAKGRKRIILCEGGPDMLAAFTLLWIATSEHSETEADFGITTLFGAGHRLHPESAAFWKNKHVRIVYHDDDAGKLACVRRQKELLAAGAAKVDAFKVNGLTNTTDGKDLNDCLSRDIEAPSLTTLIQLFLS